MTTAMNVDDVISHSLSRAQLLQLYVWLCKNFLLLLLLLIDVDLNRIVELVQMEVQTGNDQFLSKRDIASLTIDVNDLHLVLSMEGEFEMMSRQCWCEE